MMNRLVDGLVNPKLVLRYAKDHVIKVILFILVFALLAGTRTIIDTIKYDGISYAFKQEIEEQLEDVDTDCKIAFGKVLCEEEAVKLFNYISFTFYIEGASEIDSDNYDSMYNFVFFEDQLLILFSDLELLRIPISDLPDEFQNLDLSEITSDDPDLFYEQLYAGIDSYLVDTKLAWGIGVILMELIMNSLLFFGFVLFSTYFMYRRFKVIPFRDAFALTTYASSSIFVVLVFFNLLELPLLIVVVLVVVAFRQNNQMIMEIERRLKKPLDK